MQHCPSVCRCFRGICSTLTRQCENTITQSPGKPCPVTLYLPWVKANVQTTSLSIHPSIYLSMQHLLWVDEVILHATDCTSVFGSYLVLFMARTCFQTSKVNENLISESQDSHWWSTRKNHERLVALNGFLLFLLISLWNHPDKIQRHFCSWIRLKH